MDAPLGLALGDRLGEVEFLVDEQVPEQVHIGHREAESVGDGFGWEAIHQQSAQGLVAALPAVARVGEVGKIAHGSYIAYDDYYVNIKDIKSISTWNHGRVHLDEVGV
jgi:hypothetical protein